MRLRSRVASIAFKCLIVLVGAVGLLDQLGLFEGSFNPRFFFSSARSFTSCGIPATAPRGRRGSSTPP